MSRKDLRSDEANSHLDEPLDDLISALNKRIQKFNQKIINMSSELQLSDTRACSSLQQTEELTESNPNWVNIVSPSTSVNSLSHEDVPSSLQTLLPPKSGGYIEQICKKYKINYGSFSYGSRRDYQGDNRRHAVSADGNGVSCTGQNIAGNKRKKDSPNGRELSEAQTRKVLREIESIQSRIEKENIILTSQVLAIESIRDNFREGHAQDLSTHESAVVPQKAEEKNSSDKNYSPLLESNDIAHALQAVKDFNTLELLFDAYGITDLIEGVPGQPKTKQAKQEASPLENSKNAAAPRKRTQETPPSTLILKGSNGVNAYKPGPKMFKNEETQTLPEFLLPLDVHCAPSDGLFDKVLWVRCTKQPQPTSDIAKTVKGCGDKSSHDARIDKYNITIIDPATSREFIKKPYTPIDWDHVYDEGATNPYPFCGEALSSYPSSLASSKTLAYGGASSESGSLRAACDGSFLCHSLTQSVYSQPLAGAALHVSEPATLRTSILTEVDPLSPNKVRLALPMTHISGNSYAMGTIIVRDRDLLLFKEGAEDKKMTPLPYRAIASIRLGSTPAAADRTVIPSLNMNIPPAATQFFLMNKIQFSDTYRQFYRTVVIQPLSVGDDNQSTTTTNANSTSNNSSSVPPPSSIIFDTESDCIEFLNTLDLILNPSLRGRPFSPFSKGDIPPPAKSHVGLDYLTIAGGAGTGRRPAPCLYSPTEKRQLGFAKSAAITPLDVFPTHDPLTPAEMDFCSNLHIPPRLLSEIKSRLLSDPTRTWISALDVAVLCTPANSKVLDMRVARQVLDFFVSQNKLKVVEIVETLPAGE